MQRGAEIATEHFDKVARHASHPQGRASELFVWRRGGEAQAREIKIVANSGSTAARVAPTASVVLFNVCMQLVDTPLNSTKSNQGKCR